MLRHNIKLSVQKEINEIVTVLDREKNVCSLGVQTNIGEDSLSGINICVFVSSPVSKETRINVAKCFDSSLEYFAEEIIRMDFFSADFIESHNLEIFIYYFDVENLAKKINLIWNSDEAVYDISFFSTSWLFLLKGCGVFFDKNNDFDRIKKIIKHYPEKLVREIVSFHIEDITDFELLEKASEENDMITFFYLLDLGMDSFIQILFAVNLTYIPCQKRLVDYINRFSKKPLNCSNRIMGLLKSATEADSLEDSFVMWQKLVEELCAIVKKENLL